MHFVSTIAEARERVAAWRKAGRRVALIPTMGNLHRGHLALISAAAMHAEKIAVSIFVNPLQFDDEGDLRAYPRTLAADLKVLRAQNVALAFAPGREEMYPPHCAQGVYALTQAILALCFAARTALGILPVSLRSWSSCSTYSSPTWRYSVKRIISNWF